MTRKIINMPKNRVTQGTIFCGVRKLYSSSVECHGIAITARCDTARDFKAPLLNFLPVLCFEDWLWFESLPKCIEKVKAASLGNLRRYIIDKDGSAAVLDAFGPGKAFERQGCNDKQFLSAREQYFDSLKATSLPPRSWNSIPRSITKELNAAIKEVIGNKNQEYFFLENININLTDGATGYVILLREVRSLARNEALLLCKGIDSNMLASNSNLANELNLEFHDLAYPVGELSSPFIEQMMQSFSSLFSRVGVPDLDSNFSDRLFNKIFEE